ncbi:MAG: dihydrodipicolinate synthase family protein [Deinococcota bacterium]
MSTPSIIQQHGGVYPILPTPFTPDNHVDEVSLRQLIDFEKAMGVRGVAILGFLGEAHKLTGPERKQVVSTVIDQAGDMPVWVGVRAFGTAGAIEQGLEAKELGASAIFVAPIGVQNDAVQFDFYAEVAAATQLPIIIHDFPASFGIKLSASLIARMCQEIDGVDLVKLVDPPVLHKLSQILDANPNVAIFGGLGGEYCLEELARGAAGIMTGFAFPEILVSIDNDMKAGNVGAAAATFDKYCPLIRYEFQPAIGLAYRKHIYKARGAIAHDGIRAPGMTIDQRTKDELEAIIKRVGLSLDSQPQV